jgi:hypothetical protein
VTFAENSRSITRICRLQVGLFDHTGHVRRGTSRADGRMLVDEINRERARVGWKSLDMTGRTRRERRAA